MTAQEERAGLPARRPAPCASGKNAETAAAAREARRTSGPAPLRERRLPRAQLLHRVFAFDAFRCDRCGGRMRILAAIDQPEAIRRILDCLGLSSRAPPLTPARFPEPTDLELGFEEPWPRGAPEDDG